MAVIVLNWGGPKPATADWITCLNGAEHILCGLAPGVPITFTVNTVGAKIRFFSDQEWFLIVAIACEANQLSAYILGSLPPGAQVTVINYTTAVIKSAQ